MVSTQVSGSRILHPVPAPCSPQGAAPLLNCQTLMVSNLIWHLFVLKSFMTIISSPVIRVSYLLNCCVEPLRFTAVSYFCMPCRQCRVSNRP